MVKKIKNKKILLRIISFVVGFVLLFIGGVTFTLTTIPGVALIVWSLVGGKYKLLK